MHFSVFVTSEVEPTKEIIAELLAPYDENISVDPYWVEEDFIPDSTKDMTVEERYEYFQSDFIDDDHYKLEDGIIYRSTTYNPLSKWDWWEIGGRWEGTLLHNNGQRCNSLQRKDLDGRTSFKEAALDIRKDWDAWEAVLAEVNPPLIPKGIEHFPNHSPRYDGDHYDYEAYFNQPFYEALNLRYRKLRGEFTSIGSHLGRTLEEDLADARKDPYFGYALLHEGRWLEQSYRLTNPQNQEIRDQMYKIVYSLPSETWITIVDIHI